MKNRIQSLLVICMVLIGWQISAQSIVLETQKAPYIALADRGNPTILYGKYFIQDTAFSFELPFPITINQTKYTTLWASTRGKLTTANPSDGYPLDVLSVIDANLQGSWGDETETILSSMVINTAPERIFIIEWKDFYFREFEGFFDHLNVQIWLYEKDGKIEYHYGKSDLELIYARYVEDTLGHFGGYVGMGTMHSKTNYEGVWLYGDSTSPQIINFIPEADYRIGKYRLGIPKDSTVYVFAKQDPLGNLAEKTTNEIEFKQPTPSNIELTVSNKYLNRSVFVYNLSGQLIKKDALRKPQINIDLGSVQAGFYQVSIPLEGGRFWSHKFFIPNK